MPASEYCVTNMPENKSRIAENVPSGEEQMQCQPCTMKELQNVRASFHQGDARFSQDRRGTQCTCVALTALCHLSEASTLDQSDVDGILMDGDTLHQIQIQQLKVLYKAEAIV